MLLECLKQVLGTTERTYVTGHPGSIEMGWCEYSMAQCDITEGTEERR